MRLFCHFNDDASNEIKDLRRHLDTALFESDMRDEQIQTMKNELNAVSLRCAESTSENRSLKKDLKIAKKENQQLQTKVQQLTNKNIGLQLDIILDKRLNILDEQTERYERKALRDVNPNTAQTSKTKVEKKRGRVNDNNNNNDLIVNDRENDNEVPLPRKTRQMTTTKPIDVKGPTIVKTVKRQVVLPERSSSRIRALRSKTSVKMEK